MFFFKQLNERIEFIADKNMNDFCAKKREFSGLSILRKVKILRKRTDFTLSHQNSLSVCSTGNWLQGLHTRATFYWQPDSFRTKQKQKRNFSSYNLKTWNNLPVVLEICVLWQKKIHRTLFKACKLFNVCNFIL
jgi:hypothetical protein